jgi:hypothetical protein
MRKKYVPVEVVPLPASTTPIVIRRLGVSKIVGILSLHVVETSRLVKVGCLCVQGRGMFAVEILQHACHNTNSLVFLLVCLEGIFTKI